MGKLRKRKTAIIFGITGQDGSYLAELLLKKNYIIHGVKRRSSSANTERIDHLFDSLNFTSKDDKFIFKGDKVITNQGLEYTDYVINLSAKDTLLKKFSNKK